MLLLATRYCAIFNEENRGPFIVCRNDADRETARVVNVGECQCLNGAGEPQAAIKLVEARNARDRK